MIRIDGKYRTRDGREVRLYVVDGAANYPVHGAVKNDNGWSAESFTAHGHYHSGNGSSGYRRSADDLSPYDLIEIKPAAIDQMIAWLDGRVSERRTQGSQADFDYMLALTEARRIKAEAEKEG